DQRPPRVPEEPAFQKHPRLEGLPGVSREVAAQLGQLERVLVRLGAHVKCHEGAEKAAQRRLVCARPSGEVGRGPRTRGEFVRNAQTRRDVDDSSDAVPSHHVQERARPRIKSGVTSHFNSNLLLSTHPIRSMRASLLHEDTSPAPWGDRTMYRGSPPSDPSLVDARRMSSFIGCVGSSTCAAISPPRTGRVRSTRPAWTRSEAWSQ